MWEHDARKFHQGQVMTSALFLGSLDVSPSGDIAFSPFALYGKKEKRGVIGNVQEAEGHGGKVCTFERESSACLDCYSKYYSFGGPSDKSQFI